MKENSMRRAVREGRAALGTGLKEFASRGVPWIIEAAGFDYCAIDHEHGAFDMETIANLASWFQATNVTAIVRIHKSFAHRPPYAVFFHGSFQASFILARHLRPGLICMAYSIRGT